MTKATLERRSEILKVWSMSRLLFIDSETPFGIKVQTPLIRFIENRVSVCREFKIYTQSMQLRNHFFAKEKKYPHTKFLVNTQEHLYFWTEMKVFR